jgi:hypothetical protein
MERIKWTAMVADEQPMHEEESRSWMAMVIPSDDAVGIIRVYAPSKVAADARAKAIAVALTA